MDEEKTTPAGQLAVSDRASATTVNELPPALATMMIREAAQWLRNAHPASRVLDSTSYHQALDDAANALAAHGAPSSSPLGELTAWLREDQRARRTLLVRCHASVQG